MLWTSQTVLCVTLVVAMAATSLCTHAVPHPPHNTRESRHQYLMTT